MEDQTEVSYNSPNEVLFYRKIDTVVIETFRIVWQWHCGCASKFAKWQNAKTQMPQKTEHIIIIIYITIYLKSHRCLKLLCF